MAKQSSVPRLPRPDAESDVYTALLLVALLFILAGTAYVGYKAQTLFGTIIPPGGG